MRASGSAVAAVIALSIVGGWALVGSGQTPRTLNQGLLQEPLGKTGEAVFPAFEGWGPNKDGREVFLLGYFNRNQDQELDVPIGPNNRIEPGGPDLGQPTHFKTGRNYGVFAIEVPDGLGNNRLTWTLTANGQTSVVSFWKNPPYWIDFFKNGANLNEPPRIRFSPTGTVLQGPPPTRPVRDLTGTVGPGVPLSLEAADQHATMEFDTTGTPTPGRGADAGRGRGRGAPEPDNRQIAIIGGQVINLARGGFPGGGGGGGRGGGDRADITIKWEKYRGPGDVWFDEETSYLYNQKDASMWVGAENNAYFTAPGEYWILATANDESGNGGGGDQCCWSTAHIRVTVK